MTQDSSSFVHRKHGLPSVRLALHFTCRSVSVMTRGSGLSKTKIYFRIATLYARCVALDLGRVIRYLLNLRDRTRGGGCAWHEYVLPRLLPLGAQRRRWR
jgi:hypothetical protein